MSKKKKTLKEKKASDLRKASQSPDRTTQNSTPTYTFSAVNTTSPAPKTFVNKSVILQNSSFYTLKDLRKSITISVILFAVNTIIYLLIENNSLPLSILGL